MHVFTFAKSREKSRGQALVELALVVPIFMFLIAGAIDLGRIFYVQISVENAAREAALEASANPSSYSAGAACDTATNRVMCRALYEGKGGMYAVAPGDVSVAYNPSPARTTPRIGDTVTVTVTGRMSLITPLLGDMFGSPMTVSGSSTAQLDVKPVANLVFPTPTPTAAPTSAPTPAPTAAQCTVPNFTTGSIKKSQATALWTTAGFAAGNITLNSGQPSDYNIGWQSVTKNTTGACASLTISVGKQAP